MSRLTYIALGLFAGLIVGGVRTASINFANELAGFDGQRIGQRDFERAVVTILHNRPAFTQLTVYPYHLNGASSADATRVHVVTGLYCDGQPRDDGSGRRALDWKPAYFVASAPFRTVGPGAGVASPVHAGVPFDDVRAFLAAAGPAHNVAVRYASWWWLTRPIVVWPTAGFVVVGLIWPTVVNLLTYGTFSRPRIPRGIALTAAPSKASHTPAPPAPATAADFARELDTAVSAPPAPTPAATPSTPRPLTSTPLNATKVSATPQKEFRSKKEDYYPTERSPTRKRDGTDGE